jgi:hypothetical protein
MPQIAHTEMKIGISLREIPETPFLFAAWKSDSFSVVFALSLPLSLQDGDKALEEHLVRMVELTSAGAGSTAYIGNYLEYIFCSMCLLYFCIINTYMTTGSFITKAYYQIFHLVWLYCNILNIEFHCSE